MKNIILFILLTSSIASYAATICDLFENESIADLTALSVPNCISDDAIFSENEARDSSTTGPICNTCKQSLNSRVSINDDDKKRLKQQAYLESLYSEFEKSMSSVAVEMVSMRKLFSTGSTFQNSQKECNPNKLSEKMNSCGALQKQFVANKSFSSKISNEIISLVTGQSGQGGFFQKPQDLNSCQISDQDIISLKPLLLEESITPELVRKIATLNPTKPEDIWNAVNDKGFFELFNHHPLFKSLIESPKDFVNFFKPLASISDPLQLKRTLRSNLYNRTYGDRLDSLTAGRCSQAIDTLVAKICSTDFDKGNISLGPFSGFEKYNNDKEYPSEDAVTSEDLLTRNLTMLEFCEEPSRNGLSISRDSAQLNNWLRDNEKNATLKSFLANKYSEEFGAPKRRICAIKASGNCSDNSKECKLFKIYQKSLQEGTEEYTLAHNPDKAINKIMRMYVGNPTNIDSETKRILVNEGILPNSDGKYVERNVPERQPEYLAGVANGTITPSTGGTAASVASSSPSRSQRPTQAQAQIFQAAQGNSAGPNEITSNIEDDSEALRRFEQGLDDRLKRVEGQQPVANNAATSTQPNRRQASRPDSSGRNFESPQSTSVAATPVVASAATSDVVAPVTSSSSQSSTVAKLGPDNSRQAFSQQQKMNALIDMDKKNQVGISDAGRSPASVNGQAPESSITLNIASNDNLEQILSSNENLKALIQEQKPFRFRLNNNLFDVQFNNGAYSVSFRSGDNRGRELVSSLQGIFNNSLRRSPSSDRNATLESLQNTIRN